MCVITVAPSLPKKRVSFRDTHEVFAVEKVDAALVQELFYNREDYRRFRSERRRQAVVEMAATSTSVNSGANTSAQRRRLSSKATAARRQKFQHLVSHRNARIMTPSSRLVRESSVRMQSLQGMRSHMTVLQQ